MSDAATIYERVLGPDYARLAPAVARFHRLAGRWRMSGRVRMRGPRGALPRLLARALGAPLADGDGPLAFELDARPDREIWLRRFPARAMDSTLSFADGRIVERLGAATLTFALTAAADGRLVMELLAMRFFGLPCPAWLRPRIVAEERGSTVDGGDRFHFLVGARVPLVGPVVHYEGWIDLASAERIAA